MDLDTGTRCSFRVGHEGPHKSQPAPVVSEYAPKVHREGVATAMSTVGSKGADAVRTLGASVMSSARAFEERCEMVADLLDKTARDLANQAEETLKMIEQVTAEVEKLQGQAIETSQGLKKVADRPSTEGV
jgi:hypothetical protein